MGIQDTGTGVILGVSLSIELVLLDESLSNKIDMCSTHTVYQRVCRDIKTLRKQRRWKDTLIPYPPRF